MVRSSYSAWVILAASLLAAGPVYAADLIDWPDLHNGESAYSNGRMVEIVGYMVPVDRDGDHVHEFMLVSYPGACSHGRQPPSTQIIHVHPRRSFEISRNYEVVRVSGMLLAETQKTQFWMMDGIRVVETAYRMSQADVAASAPPQQHIFPTNPMLRRR